MNTKVTQPIATELTTTKLQVISAGATHVGRVRTSNQDNYTICRGGRLTVVADGMGGHACGEVASKLAVDAFTRDDATPSTEAEVMACIDATICRANEDIAAEIQRDRSRRGMGTTIVVMAYLQEEVHILHVGDSRAYLLPLGAELKSLTTDHSMVEELIKCGSLTREEAKDFPNRNIIMRALGAGGKPDHTSFPPQAGDVVLLCTDGLCGVVPEGEIAALLRDASADNLGDVCQHLIALALSNGGPDNIAVVVSIFV